MADSLLQAQEHLDFGGYQVGVARQGILSCVPRPGDFQYTRLPAAQLFIVIGDSVAIAMTPAVAFVTVLSMFWALLYVWSFAVPPAAMQSATAVHRITWLLVPPDPGKKNNLRPTVPPSHELGRGNAKFMDAVTSGEKRAVDTLNGAVPCDSRFGLPDEGYDAAPGDRLPFELTPPRRKLNNMYRFCVASPASGAPDVLLRTIFAHFGDGVEVLLAHAARRRIRRCHPRRKCLDGVLGVERSCKSVVRPQIRHYSRVDRTRHTCWLQSIVTPVPAITAACSKAARLSERAVNVPLLMVSSATQKAVAGTPGVATA